MNRFFSLFSRNNVVKQTSTGSGNIQVGGSCIISNGIQVTKKGSKTKIVVDGMVIVKDRDVVSINGKVINL